MDDDGLHALACLTIAQACADVLGCLNKDGDIIDRARLNELSAWFHSDECDATLAEAGLRRIEQAATIVRSEECYQMGSESWARTVGHSGVRTQVNKEIMVSEEPVYLKSRVKNGRDLLYRLMYDHKFRKYMRACLRQGGLLKSRPSERKRGL